MSHLLVLLDCSGSMDPSWTEVIQGFQNFITEQKKQIDDTILTLITFAFEPKVLYNKVPLSQFPDVIFAPPNGQTCLYDTIKLAIEEFKDPRPTLMVIITDGEDTCSRTTQETANTLISQEKQNGWTFVYLCNDPTLIQQSRSLGIHDSIVSAQMGSSLARQVSQATTAHRVASRQKSSLDHGC